MTRRGSASPPASPSTRCAGCARSCRIAPARTAWRVVIVDEANELNVNAANALLKSLEEPPARTVFLLVSSAPGRLLPTIRSRCRTLSLQPLSPADLRAAATQAFEASGNAAPDAAAWAPLERLAEGSVGRLLSLHGAGGLELNERVIKPRWRACRGRLARRARAFGRAAADRRAGALRAVLRAPARLCRPPCPRSAAAGRGPGRTRKLAARLIGEGRLASFAALWERIGREKTDTLALNLDRKSSDFGDLRRLGRRRPGPQSPASRCTCMRRSRHQVSRSARM